MLYVEIQFVGSSENTVELKSLAISTIECPATTNDNSDAPITQKYPISLTLYASFVFSIPNTLNMYFKIEYEA